MQKKRPKHLALYQIKLPLPGVVSIFHRASGLLLFLALPLLLLMLQESLRSAASYAGLAELLKTPLARMAMLGLLWAFLLHFCAGLRYLAIDAHFLKSLRQARESSMVVLVASLLLTMLIGVRLW
jgi:succinate dehydrogenase / fumarate reductase, cytochrome b subunit